jgi:integrase
MFYTGLRPSEALGLTWDRIDLGKMEIAVDRQLSRELNESIFVDPKTLASSRTVYFGPVLKDLLIAHRENFGEGPHGLLTSNRYGGVYRYNSASDAFNKIAKKLELSIGSGLHMLRHTYASESIAAGVNMKELQEQLGHASITETMDTYGHLMSDNRSHFATKHDEAIKQKLKEANRRHLRAAE